MIDIKLAVIYIWCYPALLHLGSFKRKNQREKQTATTRKMMGDGRSFIWGIAALAGAWPLGSSMAWSTCADL